jgi:uncharacterized protein (TIGR02271 family)
VGGRNYRPGSDQRIAWQSVDGSLNAGTITFEELGPDRTLVTATIEYEPEGFVEKAGDALGLPSGRIEGDLKRFRDYIEERGRETGGWRGQIGKNPSWGSTQATRPAQGFRGSATDTPPETAGEEPAVESGTIEVPLSEEEVKVGKQKASAGDIKVPKTVSTEQVNVPVELKREDAVIERISAHEVGQTGKEAFQEERIEVPLSREVPVVEKETRVTGGVRVRKTEGVEQETIQESVRREDVDIDESGKASGSRKPRMGTGEEKH